MQSFDLSVERSLPSGMTVSATYMNSRGDKLPFFRDINFNPANSHGGVPGGRAVPMGRFPFYRGTRPNTADFKRMIVMESTVETQYNALVLAATKRFVDGLMFNVNYTLSKAEDNGQSSATFFGGNLPFDSLNYRTSGPDNTMFPSNNDRRHRFVGSFHYQPTNLWGIGISGILTLESGLPISQRISGNLNARDRRHTIRPARTEPADRSSRRGSGSTPIARLAARRSISGRAKDFRLGGSKRVQVLWEVFNVFNTQNYATFSDTAYSRHRDACV